VLEKQQQIHTEIHSFEQ